MAANWSQDGSPAKKNKAYLEAHFPEIISELFSRVDRMPDAESFRAIRSIREIADEVYKTAAPEHPVRQ